LRIGNSGRRPTTQELHPSPVEKMMDILRGHSCCDVHRPLQRTETLPRTEKECLASEIKQNHKRSVQHEGSEGFLCHICKLPTVFQPHIFNKHPLITVCVQRTAHRGGQCSDCQLQHKGSFQTSPGHALLLGFTFILLHGAVPANSTAVMRPTTHTLVSLTGSTGAASTSRWPVFLLVFSVSVFIIQHKHKHMNYTKFSLLLLLLNSVKKVRV